MDTSSSISTNEVKVNAKHTINLGKSYIEPSSFLVTKNARKLLATKHAAFTKTYGTHYIAGVESSCLLDISLVKKVEVNSDKSKMVLELKASYDGAAASGSVDAKGSM